MGSSTSFVLLANRELPDFSGADIDAEIVVAQMIPNLRIEDLIELYSGEYGESENRDAMVGTMLGSIIPDTVVSDEDVFQTTHDKMLGEVLSDVLSTLTPREESVLKLRYGFNGRERTLEEVGREFNITRERVRQIEEKALRKLRHPSRSKKLKEYL